MPACPSLLCFFDRGNTVGTSSLKILIFVYVYLVLYGFVLELVLWILENVRFDDLCAEQLGNRLKFVFNPDIILCG